MDQELYKDKEILLRKAIKGEEDGSMFYDFLAEKAANPEAKMRLSHLRDDERRHKAVLISLFKKHVGPEVGPLPEKGIGALAQVLEKGKVKRLKSEMEYLSLAIEAELATNRFYREGVSVVKDKEFREILHQLAEEENLHYEILMAEREALTGNYFWFSTDSSSPMED